MESNDHCTPVGRQVGAMESIGHDRNERDGDELHQRDQQGTISGWKVAWKRLLPGALCGAGGLCE
jgi:hypothetical protein